MDISGPTVEVKVMSIVDVDLNDVGNTVSDATGAVWMSLKSANSDGIAARFRS